MPKETNQTYPERAKKGAVAARKVAFTKAATHLEKYKSATLNIGELRVLRLNQLRAAGEQFNLGCGRDQLQFGLEGIEFTRKEILPFMPTGIGVNEVHACVLIANKMPEPAKTPAEADLLEKQFQHEFEMLGLVQSRKRVGLQSQVTRNLFSDFVNKFAGIRVTFDELEKEAPMNTWPAFKLDEFLETSAPVMAMVEKAKKLRVGKGLST